LITVSRRLVGLVRAAHRRVFGNSSSNLGPAVRISTGPDGMRVSASDRAAAFCYHRPDVMPEHEICLPRAFLDTCQGKRDDTVEIEWGQAGSIAAWWDDGGVPCRASFDRPDAPHIHAMPDRPTQMSVNRPELLRAMIDAVTCCDPGSVRYALGCLQLDGAKGKISATDGRQIFRASGFQLPWPETVLVPKSSVFAWKELAGNNVSIGRQGDWLWFDIGP
jgi:hypothetical protein